MYNKQCSLILIIVSIIFYVLWNASNIVSAVYFLINILCAKTSSWSELLCKKILFAFTLWMTHSSDKRLLCSDLTTIIQKWGLNQTTSSNLACTHVQATVHAAPGERSELQTHSLKYELRPREFPANLAITSPLHLPKKKRDALPENIYHLNERA